MANEREFDRLMQQIQQHISTVQSIRLYGKPVTPPMVDITEEVFYIVRLMGDLPNDYVDQLFRSSDMYYLGFKPAHQAKYFVFRDIKLPSWIEHLHLPYGSEHGEILNTIFGLHWWNQILYTYMKCTSQNFEKHDVQRLKVLKWSILLFAEPPRLRSHKTMIGSLIASGEDGDIGSAEEGIHTWKTLSKVGFRYKMKPEYIHSMHVLHTHTNYNLFCEKKEKLVPWPIVGAKGEILVFKYDEMLVLHIIKIQQDAALGKICELLKKHPSPRRGWKNHLHPSLRPNVPTYLVFILTRGEEISVRVRVAAGLLLKNSLRKDFRRMVIASQEYAKSELVHCICEGNKRIQSTARAVSIAILKIIGASQWKDLFKALQDCMKNGVLNQMEGAMLMMLEICEGVPLQVDCNNPGLFERTINIFFTSCLEMFGSTNASLRKLALDSVNCYIIVIPTLLRMYVDDSYLRGLFYLLKENGAGMRETRWKEREAVAKFIGSIAEVHIDGAHPRLPEVINLMIGLLKDEACAVSTATCMSLYHYSNFIVQSLGHPNGLSQFEDILRILHERMSDIDYDVERAAVSALAVFEEEAANLQKIIHQLSSKEDLFPLIRCFKTVAKIVHPGFSQLAYPVLHGCLNVIKSQLLAEDSSHKAPIILHCLHVLSVLARGVSADIGNLITPSFLREILVPCCEYEVAHVRVGAVVLAGDLSEVVQSEELAEEFRAIVARFNQAGPAW